jgi:hypothetical protein
MRPVEEGEALLGIALKRPLFVVELWYCMMMCLAEAEVIDDSVAMPIPDWLLRRVDLR